MRVCKGGKASRAVKDKYVYSAFGDAESRQSTSTNQAYRYTGKPLDEELNLDLYYYGGWVAHFSVGFRGLVVVYLREITQPQLSEKYKRTT